MNAKLAHVLARLTAPYSFGSPRRTANKLYGFALAEHESMLEMRAAAARAKTPERCALYLRHALDEQRHATTFNAHAADIMRSAGETPFVYPKTDWEKLYDTLGELRFLAFVHRGEARGKAQFEAYIEHFRKTNNDKLRAMFVAIVEDEARHTTYTQDLLLEVAGSESAARNALRWAALWENWRGFRRVGRGLAHLVYRVLMTAVYFALTPLLVLLRIRRTRAVSASGKWLEK